MNLLDAQYQVFRETYALHQIYASIGIDPNDILMSFDVPSPETGKPEVAVLARNGEYSFVFTLGTLRISQKAFMKKWADFIKEVNKTDQKQRAHIVKDTQVMSRAAEILSEMLLKGFSSKGFNTEVAK